MHRPAEHRSGTSSAGRPALVVALVAAALVAVVAGASFRLDPLAAGRDDERGALDISAISSPAVAAVASSTELAPPVARDLVVPLAAALVVLVVWVACAEARRRHRDGWRRCALDGGPGRRGPPRLARRARCTLMATVS